MQLDSAVAIMQRKQSRLRFVFFIEIYHIGKVITRQITSRLLIRNSHAILEKGKESRNTVVFFLHAMGHRLPTFSN